jgi:hypothetical protein
VQDISDTIEIRKPTLERAIAELGWRVVPWATYGWHSGADVMAAAWSLPFDDAASR